MTTTYGLTPKGLEKAYEEEEQEIRCQTCGNSNLTHLQGCYYAQHRGNPSDPFKEDSEVESDEDFHKRVSVSKKDHETLVIEKLMGYVNSSDTNPKDLIGQTKPPLAYNTSAGAIHESDAMADGASKYNPYNWREKKIQAMIYASAALRHLMSWIDGDEITRDSYVHHLGAVRACCGIILDAQEGGHLIDNRPKKGSAADVIDRLTKKNLLVKKLKEEGKSGEEIYKEIVEFIKEKK